MVGLLLPLFAGLACQTEKSSEHEMTTTDNKIPFEIQLTNKGRKISAVLRNVSDAEQLFLHTSLAQSSELVLSDSEGNDLSSFDTRSIKKYDNTIYRSYFEALAPAKQAEMFNAEFKSERGGYKMRWGPWEFEGIQPGKYSVQVVWTSAIVDCVDDDTEEDVQMEGVWLGTVKSNSVEINLR